MSKVYFLKGFKGLVLKVKNILADFYSAKDKVLIKIHFGEPGNKFAFMPKDIRPVIMSMDSLGLKSIFIDTLVAYTSPRNSIKGYKKVVKERGYDQLAPFLISKKSKKIKTKDFVAGVCFVSRNKSQRSTFTC